MNGNFICPHYTRAIALAFLTAAASPAFAQNIAPQGVGLIGVNDAIDADAGTPRANAGVAAAVNDGQLTTRVDTYFPGNTAVNSFAGVRFLSPRYENIQTLSLTLATFGDGGWFGVPTSAPGAGNPLAAGDLEAPTVQISRDAGITWETVASTSDYLTVMTGHRIGGGTQPLATSATSTFTLGEYRTGQQQVYLGRNVHVLKKRGDTLRMSEKKVLLLNNDDALGNLTFLV